MSKHIVVLAMVLSMVGCSTEPGPGEPRYDSVEQRLVPDPNEQFPDDDPNSEVPESGTQSDIQSSCTIQQRAACGSCGCVLVGSSPVCEGGECSGTACTAAQETACASAGKHCYDGRCGVNACSRSQTNSFFSQGKGCVNTDAYGSDGVVSGGTALISGAAQPLVYNLDAPDPSALLSNETLHVFATTSNPFGDGAHNVAHRVGKSGATFVTVGDALPTLPSTNNPDGSRTFVSPSIWAPHVRKIGSNFVMYYSGVKKHDPDGSGPLAATVQGRFLYRATTTNLATPFVTIGGPTPWMNDDGAFGVIDPYIINNHPNGNNYLMFKRSGLEIVRLNAAGTDYYNPSSPNYTTLLTRGANWEGTIVENPAMVRLSNQDVASPPSNVINQWALFYSGDEWKTQNYAIGYAYCNNAFDNCTKKTTSGGPLLGSVAGSFYGPGGASFFTQSGKEYMLFHGWRNNCKPGTDTDPDCTNDNSNPNGRQNFMYKAKLSRDGTRVIVNSL